MTRPGTNHPLPLAGYFDHLSTTLAANSWPDLLHATGNNIGHGLIEIGMAKLLSSITATDCQFDLAFQWRFDPTVLNSPRPLIVVTSSNLVSKLRPEFNEQDSEWVSYFERLLEDKSRPTLIVNIGIGGVPGEVQELADLDLAAHAQIHAMQKHRNLSIWFREDLSLEILAGHLSCPIVSLGCPSFAILGKQVHDAPQEPMRILLTGVATQQVKFLEDRLTPASPEYWWIPQSRAEQKSVPSNQNSINIFRPSSITQWGSFIEWLGPNLVIGTRLHGGLISLALGHPTAIVSGDIRTKGLSRLVGIPHFEDFDEISPSAIAEKIATYNLEIPTKLSNLVERQAKHLEKWLESN